MADASKDSQDSDGKITGKDVGTDNNATLSDKICFSKSLLDQCFIEISPTNLDDVIIHFRQVLGKPLISNSLRCDAMRHLASALGLRYICATDMSDVQDLLLLWCDLFTLLEDHTQKCTVIEDHDDDNAKDLLQDANAKLSALQQAPASHVINTVISILQTSLPDLQVEAATLRATALTILAQAMYTRYHCSFETSDLDYGITCLRGAIMDLANLERNPLHGHTSCLLCVMLIARLNMTNNMLDLDEALAEFERAADADAGISTDDVSTRFCSAIELHEQFRASGSICDLNASVSAYEVALSGLPADSDDYPFALTHLALILWERFQHTRHVNDLDQSILLTERALPLLPASHPALSVHLNNLASTLLTRFEISGKQHDLDAAVSLHTEALDLRALGNPHRPNSLNNLANTLRVRFKYTGQANDLDNAISLYEQELQLLDVSHEDRAQCLIDCAHSLAQRFEKGGQPGDLDKAVSLSRQAADLASRSASGSSHPTSLDNLASALFLRFERGSHQKADLDESISVLEPGLEIKAAPSNRGAYSLLNNLANALQTRFEEEGQLGDIDQAVMLYTEALSLQHPSSTDLSGSTYNLAAALWTRFRHVGQPDDLEKAIKFCKQSLEHKSAAFFDKPSILNNLANALQARFIAEGEKVDLDEAISLYRQALELRDKSHPSHPRFLDNLASALCVHFMQGGRRRNLDEAIILHKEALSLRPAPHPDRSDSLNNLAAALVAQFELTGQRGDLTQAITLLKEALNLRSPPHPSRANSLNNLATLLMKQFKYTNHLEELAEVISLHRQALALRNPLHPNRPDSLQKLANSLAVQFEYIDQVGYFDEACSLTQQAIDLYPKSHPNRLVAFENLGKLYASAYSRFDADDPVYLESSMSAFSSALRCSTQSASERFRAAKEWSHYADTYRHSSSFEAYDAALQILPQLVSLSLDIQSRHEALTTGIDGLARCAARCGIQNGSFEKAIEFLEAGRGIFWSQVLRLRSPFDRLRDINPELGKKLQSIANALEHGSHRTILAEMTDNRANMSLEQEALQFERLNKEWLQGLDEVRHLKGFENFLRPHNFSSLRAAASDFPVVFLVPNDTGSDCLIMTSDTAHHLSLSQKLFTGELRKLVNLIKSAASHSTVPRSLIDDAETLLSDSSTRKDWGLETRLGVTRASRAVPSDVIFGNVLAILWDELVEPVIRLLGIEKSNGTPARVQWYPTGLFTFLPIHAAGHYNSESSESSPKYAAQYIISSYVPAIGVLLSQDDFSSIAPPEEEFQMLAVVDTKRLYFARAELEKIKERVPSNRLTQIGVPGSAACVETVFSLLPTATIVHFTCHGKQNKSHPLSSALLLEDGELTISKIMQQPLPKGSLAFLCACETAMGDETIPDEAMSLGASLLFSGFRSVAATMWKMADVDGPTITDVFYEELFRDPVTGKPSVRPNIGKSAEALHTAIQHLRSKGVEFRRWVPFVHMGK